jgi:hypothetical protein
MFLGLLEVRIRIRIKQKTVRKTLIPTVVFVFFMTFYLRKCTSYSPFSFFYLNPYFSFAVFMSDNIGDRGMGGEGWSQSPRQQKSMGFYHSNLILPWPRVGITDKCVVLSLQLLNDYM